MKRYFFFLLLTVVVVESYGQAVAVAAKAPLAAQAMTLEECIQYAMVNNPNLQTAQLDEQINEHRIKEVKAAGLPQINGSGQFLHNFALAEQLLPGEVFGQPGTTIPVKFGVANTMSGNVELQQMLFNKSFFTGLQAAKSARELAQLNTLKSKEDLVYNIAQLYLQLQISERQKAILNANIDRINRLIEMAQIQFEEGLIKKVNVDQLRVNKTNLLSEKQSVEIGISQQLNLLKLYMGMPTQHPLSIAEFAAEGDRYPLTEDLILAENIDLQLLNQQFSLKELEKENVAAGYYPSVSAFVRYGWQGQTDRLFSRAENYSVQGSTLGVVGLNLSVPIFDGFRRRNQVQQLQLEQSQLILNRQYMTNAIRMEFANAQERLRQNRDLLQAQKANMELAEELYSVAQLSYREGVAPLTELLDAETSLAEAQTQYLTALLQINLAELDQMRSSGQLAAMIRTAAN